MMDPILPELRSALADLTPKSPTIPFISTVADTAGHAPCSMPSIGWPMCASRCGSARPSPPPGPSTPPSSKSARTRCSPTPSPKPWSAAHHHSIGTLQRDTHDTLTFHTNLNTTHTSNPPATQHPPEPHPVLPTTPWHHTRHWVTGTTATPVAGHPLLGIGVTDPTNGTRVWESTLGPDFLWLGDHRVDDACVLPGAAYAELALAAVTEAFGTDSDTAVDDP